VEKTDTIPLPIEWKVKKRKGGFPEEASVLPGSAARLRKPDAKAKGVERGQKIAAALEAQGKGANSRSPGPGSAARTHPTDSQRPVPEKDGRPLDTSRKIFPRKLPFEDFKGCYDTLSAAAMKAESVKALQNRGKLICWKAPGKNVYQYDDGSFIDGTWYQQTVQAFKGASRKYQDALGGNPVGAEPLGYKTWVMSYFKETGAYVNTFKPARIPDEVRWVVYFSGGYRITFDHGNSRDCIFSGNGIYTLSGPQGSINLPAQGCDNYNGRNTCIRCALECRW